MTQSGPSAQRGAALITVLLIVASMAAIAVTLNQITLNNARRVQALETQTQLRLYATAGEELAEARLSGLVQQLGGGLIATSPGFESPLRFPVEDALFELRVEDVSNCFNLNQLATASVPSADAAPTLPSPADDFTMIVETAGIDRVDARTLVAGVADWIDRDLAAALGGAEDGYYTQLDPPYRTSGLPLEILSEARAIRGFDRVTFTLLRPLICVLPAHATSLRRKLNINTLSQDQAELLRPVMSGTLEIDELRQLIARRPLEGWPDLQAFLAEPVLATIRPDMIRQDMLGTVSSHIAISVKVAYRGQVMHMSYLYEVLPDRPVRLLQRERVG